MPLGPHFGTGSLHGAQVRILTHLLLISSHFSKRSARGGVNSELGPGVPCVRELDGLLFELSTSDPTLLVRSISSILGSMGRELSTGTADCVRLSVPVLGFLFVFCAASGWLFLALSLGLQWRRSLIYKTHT